MTSGNVFQKLWSLEHAKHLSSGIRTVQMSSRTDVYQVLRVAGPTSHVNSSRLLPTGQALLLLSMKAMQQQQHSSLHLRKKITCSFLVAISVQRVIKQLLLTPHQVLPKRSHEFLSIWRLLFPMGLLGAIAVVPGLASPCDFDSAHALTCLLFLCSFLSSCQAWATALCNNISS